MLTTYKTIIKGEFDFGSPKTFDKAFKMFKHREEQMYQKIHIPFDEEAFVGETNILAIGRIITQINKKSWQACVEIFQYLSQFALTGQVAMWYIDEGKILEHKVIEPTNEKTTVQAFLKGRDLVKESGKEDLAINSLNKAIAKYEKHGLAYERRGFINMKLGNEKDALHDFSKSILFNPNIPEPHYGRAKIFMGQKEWRKSLVELELGLKKSIPLQSVYWGFRRLKALVHTELGEMEDAAQEYKFFTARSFSEDNPNFQFKKEALLNYTKILLSLERFADALKILGKSDKEAQEKADSDYFLYRGIARRGAGKTGFKKDWTIAAKFGNKEASKLLAKR